LARDALECGHAGGHEVFLYEHTLNTSFALLHDPSFCESDREAATYQCVKIKNGESRENQNRKVRPSISRESSDRSVISQGSASILIRRSGRQSRSRVSSKARYPRRVFRAFDYESGSVAPQSKYRQSFSAQLMSPSSPRSVVGAFSSSDNTGNVHGSIQVVQACPRIHRLEACRKDVFRGNVLPKRIPQVTKISAKRFS
jgi:hypothetical protein